MGLSLSSKEDGSSQASSSNVHSECDPNFRFLMGKVQNLAPAAQRLFNLGKLYLSPDDAEHLGKDKSDFENLFPTASHPDTQESEKNKAFQLFRPLKKSKPLYQGQTFVQWKVSYSNQSAYLLCMHQRNIIYIQPIDEFPDFVRDFRFQRRTIQVGLFELIQGFAQIFFSGIDVMILPDVQTKNLGWNIVSRYHQVTGQKQYMVEDFYPKLQQLLPSNGICILGFIWTDLFPENYNFVLGEASPKHRSGIFSFGRFAPSTFDPSNPQDITEITGDIIWKLIKAVSHEVSHLFGLDHCGFFDCAMNESSSVGEAMAQPLFLCPVCLRKLHQVCGFDVTERYLEMHSFLTDIQLKHPCDSIAGAIKWLDACLEFLRSG